MSPLVALVYQVHIRSVILFKLKKYANMKFVDRIQKRKIGLDDPPSSWNGMRSSMHIERFRILNERLRRYKRTPSMRTCSVRSKQISVTSNRMQENRERLLFQFLSYKPEVWEMAHRPIIGKVTKFKNGMWFIHLPTNAASSLHTLNCGTTLIRISSRITDSQVTLSLNQIQGKRYF